MSSLVSWSCSWRLMAGGQQEPIFVKGLKTESRCLGYMSEMSRKEAVLQLTQTKGSLRANWSKRLGPSHRVPGRMGFRRAEWQSQRNKDLHRGRAESLEGWNSTACLYTAWQAVVLISSHLQTEGESASLCWLLLGSVATKAGRQHQWADSGCCKAVALLALPVSPRPGRCRRTHPLHCRYSTMNLEHVWGLLL